MPKLVLIRGLPGSGKSTLAKAMEGFLHLEADMYFTDASGVYHYRRDELSFAHAWCKWRTESALLCGRNVVVSNTFTTMAEMRPYFDLAEKHKVDVTVIEALGHFPSIHGVPPETIERMKARWEPFVNEETVKD